MEFAVLSRAAAVLFTPGNLLLWGLLIGAALLFTRREAGGRVLLAVVGIAALLIAVLPVGAWLARPLEDRFPRRALPDHIHGVLILSGGPNVTVFTTRGAPAPDSSEGRLVAAVDLARHHPEARLIFSGGIAPIIGGAMPETIVARSLLTQMGIPPGRVTFEDHARSTWENFIYSKALARPRPGDAWVVVTSALNMPRAMAVAERLCWPVLAWPSDYISSGRPEGLGAVDFGGRLSTLDMVAHEWLGLAAYRLTGHAGPCIH